MNDLVCPMPRALSQSDAAKTLAAVQVRRKALSSAAQERFAAKELGVSVDEFRAALKGLAPKPPAPAPFPAPVVPKPAPPKPLPPVKPVVKDPDLPHQLAQFKMQEIQKRRPKMDQAARERLAAKEMGIDTKDFRQLLTKGATERKAAVSWLDDLPPIKGLKRHEDAFHATNPNYVDGYGDNMQWSINCAKVVNAYELRMRGFNVTAGIGPANLNQFQLVNLWKKADGTTPKMHVDNWLQVAQKMMNDPPGARYQVIVVWPGRQSSHIFSARRTETHVDFFDAQIRKRDATGHLARADKGEVLWWRVDDAMPSEKIAGLLDGQKPYVPVTPSHVNKILNDIGFKQSTETKARRNHRGEEYGGGTSRTRGYNTRQIGDEVHISYFDMNAYGDDITNAMARMKDQLESQGFEVRQGMLRTQLVVTKKR